jgi:hypothetical protein
LSPPTPNAIKTIKNISSQTGKKVIALPYRMEKEDWFHASIEAGPKEFVEILAKASVVCTDSFHGTAFSVNFNIPFYVFDRQYGKANKQSERIISLLKTVSLLHRYEPSIIDCSSLFDVQKFKSVNRILNLEREKVRKYLEESIHE